MTLAELKKILETTGLPVTYRAWPEAQAPAMPFICYLSEGSENFGADGIVYFSAQDVRVELYTDLYDETAMEAVEAALTGARIYWDRYTQYIETEKCYETTYELEV